MSSTWGPKRALGKRKFQARTAHLTMHPKPIAKHVGFSSQGLSSHSLNVFFSLRNAKKNFFFFEMT